MSGMRTGLAAALLVAGTAGIAASASAQTLPYLRPGGPQRGSIEVSAGGVFSPGFDLDARNATLTRATDPEPFALFAVDGKTTSLAGAFARVGIYVNRALEVEGGVRFARPQLRYRLSSDAESAADETATESVTHYIFEGAVAYHFVGASFSDGHGVPFVAGGAGHLRELHEGSQLVETGNEFHVTAGINYRFGERLRTFGVRVEGGLSSRQKGIDASEDRRMQPILLGGITYLF